MDRPRQLPANWFDIYHAFHCMFTVSLLVAHFLYITFAPGFLENFMYTGALLVVLFTLLFGIGYVVEKVLDKKSPKVLKYFMTISLAIICVMGFIPRIMVYFVGYDYYILVCSMFTFLFLPVFIHGYHLPNFQYDNFYSRHPKFISMICFVHLVLFLACLRFATAYYESWDMAVIIVFQVMFSLMPMFANIDMVMVAMGETRWVLLPEGTVFAPPYQPVAPVDLEAVLQEQADQGPVIECQICLLPYSNENLPRILKECGHTICTACAVRLMTQYHNQYLLCPTCRMATVVNGDATQLPMNHSLMGMVKEMKKKKIEAVLVEASNELNV